MYLIKDGKPVIFNNFRVSAELAKALNSLQSGKYLTPHRAGNPMHIVKIDPEISEIKEGDIYKFSFLISFRKVTRPVGVIPLNYKGGLVKSETDTILQTNKERIVNVPFLIILIQPAVKVFDETPVLNFHQWIRKLEEGDEVPSERFDLLELYTSSRTKIVGTTILFVTEMWEVFKTHPRIITHPSRNGLHEIIWSSGKVTEVRGYVSEK